MWDLKTGLSDSILVVEKLQIPKDPIRLRNEVGKVLRTLVFEYHPTLFAALQFIPELGGVWM
jgi:hypothetical protein